MTNRTDKINPAQGGVSPQLRWGVPQLRRGLFSLIEGDNRPDGVGVSTPGGLAFQLYYAPYTAIREFNLSTLDRSLGNAMLALLTAQGVQK